MCACCWKEIPKGAVIWIDPETGDFCAKCKKRCGDEDGEGNLIDWIKDHA